MQGSVRVNFEQCSSPALHFNYHLYVIDALRTQTGLQISFDGTGDALLAHLASLRAPGAHTLWEKLARRRLERTPKKESLVSYRFDIRGYAPVEAVIDPGDHRDLRHPEALEWADLYFKTNRWPGIEYPGKVLPLMNGNGLLSPRRIDRLRRMREAPRTKDLVYWTKVWEPGTNGIYTTNDVHNIVEHQLRLFEALSKLDADTDLLALVPYNLRSMRREECVARLEQHGVKCQLDWGAIDSERLWAALAGARTVFLRPGNHSCISWRMTDLLALGSCIVYDGIPHPNWYMPLKPDVHYVDGGCAAGIDYSLPGADRYTHLIRTIEQLLTDEPRLTATRRASSEHFDRFYAHERLGAYIMDAVAGFARQTRPVSIPHDAIGV